MVNVCVMYYSKILKVTRIILFFGLSSSVNLAEEDNVVISYIVNYEEINRLEEKIYELSQKILDDYQVSTTNEKIEFNAEKYFIGFKVIRIDEKNFLELKFNKKKIEEYLNAHNLFISGDKGLGKTFLLNCALNHKKFSEQKCLYIDIENLSNNVQVFNEIDSFSVICIDNIHCSNKDIEVELFNLVNKAFTSKTKLLISSQLHITQLNLFPDLLSRIKQMSCFSIEQISDDEVDDVIDFMNTKLKLFFSKELIKDISKIVRRDISSIKDLFVEIEQFLYSEKKRPSKRTIMGFLKKRINQ